MSLEGCIAAVSNLHSMDRSVGILYGVGFDNLAVERETPEKSIGFRELCQV